MSNPTPQSAPPSRALRWGVAGSVVVMIAAGGLFYYASQLAAGKRQTNHNEIAVTIHGHACEPNALTVPAGHASFRIINRSDRAVEWEILDGVLVVEERENIAPGLSQVINANLLPGDYAITCGLLSNPRGTLHVTPTAESDAQAKAKPSMVAFIGPLSEFRVYLSSQGGALVKAVTVLQQAIAAGDLAQAQALYVPAREAYQRLAPASQRLAGWITRSMPAQIILNSASRALPSAASTASNTACSSNTALMASRRSPNAWLPTSPRSSSNYWPSPCPRSNW